MKIASRYLLPLELYVGIVMLSWGVSGYVGRGHLSYLVHAESEPLAWGIALGGVGALQLFGAAVELLWGRRWSAPSLLGSVSVRCIAAFLAVGIWVYACYLLTVAATVSPAGSLIIQAPVTLLFNLWVYSGNLRVRCVLNPDCKTTKLQAKIMAERRTAIGDPS